jgi:hypothetical protein
MNGNFSRHGEDEDGLDPELTRLFDAAAVPEPAAGASFVSSLLRKMQHARRLRLVAQLAGVAVVMTATAFLAPYVAEETLGVAGWLADRMPAADIAIVSPIGCVLAVIAWRMTHRTRTY